MATQNKDLYKVLGVERGATIAQIKAAYRKLARQFHPDRYKGHDSATKMNEVNEAYNILSDAERRKRYDESGDVRPTPPKTEAEEVLWAVIESVVLDPGNIVTNACRELHNFLKQGRDAVKATRKKVRMLEKRLGCISGPDENNEFAEVILGKIGELNHMIDHDETTFAMLDKVQARLNLYHSSEAEAEKKEADPMAQLMHELFGPGGGMPGMGGMRRARG